MAAYLNSNGLNGVFVPINSAREFSSPIGGIVYNYNWDSATLGGTYDSFGYSGIRLNTSIAYRYNIHIRRDTQSSTIAIDRDGLRGFSNTSSPKIGQYVIKGSNTTVSGGTYRGIKCYYGYYNRYYLWENLSASGVSENAGIFYRYA